VTEHHQSKCCPFLQFLNDEVMKNSSGLRNGYSGSDRCPPPAAMTPSSTPPALMNDGVLARFLLDFFNLLARFFFYYQKVNDLPQFIQSAQDIFSNAKCNNNNNKSKNNDDTTTTTTATTSTSTACGDSITSDESGNTVILASTDISNVQNPPRSRQELAKISAADNFVDSTIRQIKLIKNEYVLVKYIQKCVHFQGLTLRDTTQVKLQTLLYDYTSPGGPLYPPRSVRHAATESLDALFPRGKVPRRYIHLFFRLLHPYYATRSISHWLYSYVKPFLLIFGASLEEEEDESVLRRLST